MLELQLANLRKRIANLQKNDYFCIAKQLPNSSVMQEQNVAVRLKHFLDSQGLSSSKFADACGIPRPSLSQLLNGRNRKISDVMVGQIHTAYPELSVLWLLFGEGPMLMPDEAEAETETPEEPQSVSFRPLGGPEDNFAKELGLDLGLEPLDVALNKAAASRRAAGAPPVQIAAEAPAPRKVSHITVYYDDSTFETFFPK